MHHARPEEGVVRDTFSDDGFALEVPLDVFENENIVRLPDVVKRPPLLAKV